MPTNRQLTGLPAFIFSLCFPLVLSLEMVAGRTPVIVMVVFLSCLLTAAGLASSAGYQILHLSEGDKCREGPQPLYCKQYTNCPGIEQAVKRAIFPKICSFKGRNNPIVCCDNYVSSVSSGKPKPPPPKPSTSEGNGFTTPHTPKQSKADRMCEKYSEYVYKKMQFGGTKAFCGMVAKPLIANGEPAGPREFPHMARIGYGESPRILWGCGGSLISERYILSAAHCTNPAPDMIANWANLGDLDVSTDMDDAEPVTLKITERIDHPDYKPEYVYHDIALYKLERDAPLGIYIRPICLNTKPFKHSKAIASGWGRTDYRIPKGSPTLQKVELNMISNKVCNDSYRPNIGPRKQLPQGIVSDFMICAGGGREDTCKGDSGGPLQTPLNTPYCMYSLVGVTSFGIECSLGVPGAYVNVANYIPWIENIVWQ